MGMRANLPRPFPSPKGRGEVDENLYSGRKEGEGEGARGEDKSTKYRLTL